MKNILIGLLMLFSCHQQKEVRSMGALPIDKNELNKVPMIVSEIKPPVISESLVPLTAMKGKPDRIAPTVAFVSPTNGQSFDLNAIVPVKVMASDNVGIASITITIDDIPFSGTQWTASITGIHTFTVVAKDKAGNASERSITIVVNAVIINPPPIDTTKPPPPPVLPASVNLSMPSVQSQGGSGTCVGFAVAYARDAGTGQIFSPAYIFDRITTSLQCEGSGLITGCNFLRDTGVCKWSTVPYIDGSCSRSSTSPGDAEAGQYRAKSYSQILSSDITAIKTLLASGKSLVFQCSVDNQFYNAKPGFIWNSFTGAIGLHALCMCGYDDSKHAFKIINSWGIGWGDAGYSWIDYDFYKTACSNLLVFNY